jgi:predicted dehydrogenase
MRSVFPKFNFRTILHGDCGYLSTDEYTPKNIYAHAAKEGAKNILKRIAGRKPTYLSYTYYWESYYKEMTSFFKSIANDTETSASAEEGLKTMQIIEQAYKMSRKIDSENQ